jgi:hypothetical protein
MTTTYPESPGTHTIVLPGGGYAAHAPHEAEPVASWLSEIGMQASVFRYPLNVRHPAPLDALRAEIRRRRADGAQRIGLIGFSAGGHLAGLAALAPGAAADQTVQFAVLGYAITSMETETYRRPGSSCSARTPARSCAGRHRWIRWLRLSRRRSSSGIPQRTPTSPPNTPTASPPPSRLAVFLTPCTCSPTARTASAWPRALARPRSGPRWRKPGSGNRRHHRDDPASRAHRPQIHRQVTRMYQPPSAEPPPGTRIATGPQIPVMREQLRGETNERKPAKARSQAVLELRQAGSPRGRQPDDLPRVRGDVDAVVISCSR